MWEGRDGERESVIALGMCLLSGVYCDWTRLGCRLACNLQGRFYMAPSWSTCDPLSCFSFPLPLPLSLPLHTASFLAHTPAGRLSFGPSVQRVRLQRCLIAMQSQTMDPATSRSRSYTGNSPTSASVPSLVSVSVSVSYERKH